MKLGQVVKTIPTIGFNVERVTVVKGLTLTVWDVGGQDKLRRLWKHYYQESTGMCFEKWGFQIQTSANLTFWGITCGCTTN